MATLRLDNTTHRAFLGDRELMRVTTALSEGLALDTRYFTEASRVRGSWLHQAAARHFRRQSVGYVPDDYQPYFDGLLYVIDTMGLTPYPGVDGPTVEQPVYDEAHGYAGEYDFLGRFESTPPGWLELVDWKSGGLPPTVGAPTAANRRPLTKVYGHKIRRWATVLPGNHKGKLEPLSLDRRQNFDMTLERRDEQRFLNALGVAQWKREMAA